jgi:hypothetical protein
VVAVLEQMGNPFLDEGNELYAIDSHIICNREVVETVRNIEAIGREQYEVFTKDRLIKPTVAVNASISRNKLALFKNSGPKRKACQSKLMLARNDCSLFSKL